MYRLFSLSALLVISISAEPRTPKIYNVLISTKKNLSPSHALPIYEPVLRTTSLGLALPSVFYQSPLAGYQPPSYNNYIPQNQQIPNGPSEPNDQNDGNNQGLQPLPVDQFIPYTYTPQALNNRPYYTQTPMQAQPPQQVNYPSSEQYYENPDDPKTIVANLKRNPEIPDVPPPALPVKSSQQ